MKRSMMAVGTLGLVLGLCGCPGASQPVAGKARGAEQEASGDVRAADTVHKIDAKDNADPAKKGDVNPNLPPPPVPPTPQPPVPPTPPPPR